MTTEEKARAYDKALKRAKSLIGDTIIEESGQHIAEVIFPELKESEDKRIREEIIEYLERTIPHHHRDEVLKSKEWTAWLEKQGEQKPADTVELKCEESKTKVFDAPTPFEDKLYAFVLACEILVDPSKREFILEHSQEILDAAREQIGKEQSSTWCEEDELVVEDIEEAVINYWHGQSQEDLLDWLKSLKTRYTWKPSDKQMAILYKYAEQNNYDGSILTSLYNELKKLREE